MIEEHLATSEQGRPRCPVWMPSGWYCCDQLLDHDDDHMIWLTGYGHWSWPNKKAVDALHP